jgi:polar amino acid transport system substrate-binding protein
MKKKIIIYLSLVLITLAIPLKSSLGEGLGTIEERGKLIVAVKDNLRPLAFRDAQGKLQGLEIDIARGLAKELLGNSEALILKPVNNQERLKVVIEHQVDLSIARVTRTPSRSRVVNFSLDYYLDGTGLITKNPSIKQLRDLDYKKIAVLNHSDTIAVIRYNLPKAELIGVNSYQEAKELLERGGAQAFSSDRSVLTGWVQEYPEYHLLENRLSQEALCIVLPKGLKYTELLNKINSVIISWRKTDWLKERVSYWGLP